VHENGDEYSDQDQTPWQLLIIDPIDDQASRSLRASYLRPSNVSRRVHSALIAGRRDTVPGTVIDEILSGLGA